jgi:hypothetical protein
MPTRGLNGEGRTDTDETDKHLPAEGTALRLVSWLKRKQSDN